MDNLTRQQRHKNMQQIKSQDTSIEIMLRKALWQRGIHYRKNVKALVGKPDILLTKYKIAIFCDSDFWHGRDIDKINHQIKSNRQYWIPKIERNRDRDKEVNDWLLAQGWLVLRFWGSDIKKNVNGCVKTVLQYLP